MKRQLCARRLYSRSALTMIDVIATVFAILMLLQFFLLFLPAVGSHGPHPRLECMNNLKQLGMAAIDSAAAHGGQIPLLSAHGPGLASDIQVGWPIHLFPHMDNAGAIEYIETRETKREAAEALALVQSSSYKALQCPLGPKQFKQPGGISFAANIGYGAWFGTPTGIVPHYDFGAADHGIASIDWNLNGKLDATDLAMTRQTGVFWMADERLPPLRIADIVNGDGAASTILFAETLNLPPMHQTGTQKNGQNPGALELGFGIGYDALRLFKEPKPSLLLDRNAKASTEFTKYFRPNSNQNSATGRWPVASSMHPKGFNVVFADGHAAHISYDIDWAVWASLHTPQGTQRGEIGVTKSDF